MPWAALTTRPPATRNWVPWPTTGVLRQAQGAFPTPTLCCPAAQLSIRFPMGSMAVGATMPATSAALPGPSPQAAPAMWARMRPPMPSGTEREVMKTGLRQIIGPKTLFLPRCTRWFSITPATRMPCWTPHLSLSHCPLAPDTMAPSARGDTT